MQIHNHPMRKILLSHHQQEIDQLEKKFAWRSIFLYIQIYTAILIAIFFGISFSNFFINILVMIFIAGRQHSLYILNHDASHYLLFHSKKANKRIATLFSNLVMFHHPEAWSFTQWRRIHLKHHSYLFTEQDPNYIGRQQAGDTERTYTSLQLLLACILAIPKNFIHFFIGKEDYVYPRSQKMEKSCLNHLAALIFPFYHDAEMERERRISVAFYVTILVIITYYHFWQPFVLFWLLPMYTFYPMILKYHDLTEHYWQKKSIDPMVNTRSEKRSTLAKIVLSFFPRQFHREHHLFPKVPVIKLPKLYLLLANSTNS